MSEHSATIFWQRADDEFAKGRYSREHIWKFDGGAVISASPSPSVVPVPFSNPGSIDPEEAFVASISSCHMLFFLDFARRKGFVIDSYKDEAIGVLSKSDSGEMWLSEVTLHPTILFGGERQPTMEEKEELHHTAHKACFIANSVKTNVTWLASN
jgi:organic hydroperoxide reductase OsmC/OhrA